jgi:hypothetical protein
VVCDQIKENRVSMTCSTNKGDGKYIHRLFFYMVKGPAADAADAPQP